MRITEIITAVVEKKTCYALRVKRNQPDACEYDAIPFYQTGKKKGWVMLDLFTASAMLQVRNALNPANQEKFDRIPLAKLIEFTWKQF